MTTVGIDLSDLNVKCGNGYVCSQFATGSNLCLSFVSIPAVMQAPAPLAAKQWYTVFTRGGSFGIPAALAGAVASAYVAFQRKSLAWKRLAGVLTCIR